MTACDHSGILVSALHEVDTDADEDWDTRTLTEYLNDPLNHTGYSQVLRETHIDADTDDVTKTIDYTFGHDEIAQTVTLYDSEGEVTSQTTHVFGHDGHGSVRVLFDLTAAIVQMYAYEAYGNLLAVQNGSGVFVSANLADSLTTQMFNGEQADRNTGMLNLRDRWYRMQFGIFDRPDRFFGNLHDPQSLHKHLFVHGDPINHIDPTGMMSLAEVSTAMGIGSNSRAKDAGASLSVRQSVKKTAKEFLEATFDTLSMTEPTDPHEKRIANAGEKLWAERLKTLGYIPIRLQSTAVGSHGPDMIAIKVDGRQKNVQHRRGFCPLWIVG